MWSQESVTIDFERKEKQTGVLPINITFASWLPLLPLEFKTQRHTGCLWRHKATDASSSVPNPPRDLSLSARASWHLPRNSNSRRPPGSAGCLHEACGQWKGSHLCWASQSTCLPPIWSVGRWEREWRASGIAMSCWTPSFVWGRWQVASILFHF